MPPGIAQDPDFSKNIPVILNPEQATTDALNFQRDDTRRILQEYQRAGGKNYSEIMVINTGGDVVVSTNANREGFNFRSQIFYRMGIIDNFVEFSRIPSFNDGKLIFTTPLYDGEIIRGILVLRAQDSLIKGIVEVTPGYPEMETYLLNHLRTAIRDYARLLVPMMPEFLLRHAEKRAALRAVFDLDALSPLAHMSRLEMPVLIVQGTADRRIKPFYAQEHFDAVPEPRELYWIEGARHGRMWHEGGEAYERKLISWLEHHMGSDPGHHFAHPDSGT